MLIYVQRVSRMLEGRDVNAPLDETVLLQYFAIEFSEQMETLSMLTMALQMRTLVVVLDGFDEAVDHHVLRLQVAGRAGVGVVRRLQSLEQVGHLPVI